MSTSKVTASGWTISINNIGTLRQPVAVERERERGIEFRNKNVAFPQLRFSVNSRAYEIFVGKYILLFVKKPII